MEPSDIAQEMLKPAPIKPAPIKVHAAYDQTGVTEKTKTILRNQEKVKIVIPSTELDKEPVFLSLNGHAYQIKRDEPVELPVDVVKNCLDNAKTSFFSVRKRKDEQEGNELVETVTLRFPYQRLS